MKSKGISALLYILLAMMWCGIIICYAVVFFISDIIQYFGNGALPLLFGAVTLLCLIMPIIFRKKLKLRVPLLLIIFSILSVVINATSTVGSYVYLSRYTPEKWDSHRELRYCMTDSLEQQYNIIGKTEKEVIKFLGKPENIADDYCYRYEYFIGYGMIDPYTYDIIFENGVAVKTQITEH